MANVETGEGRAIWLVPRMPFRTLLKTILIQMKTSKIHRQLRQQRGMTLIELLIGAGMLVAIMLAALPVIDGASTSQGRVETAAVSIADARVFSERVLRDLRPAYAFPPGPSYNSTSLSVYTFVRRTPPCGSDVLSPPDADPISCRVTYSCSGGSCTRQERELDGSGGGPPVTMIRGLSRDDIFSYFIPGDGPTFVSLDVELPNQANDDDAITLEDGTALRNVK
jgi:type II secretory pathway pseudopilin PulG